MSTNLLTPTDVKLSFIRTCILELEPDKALLLVRGTQARRLLASTKTIRKRKAVEERVAKVKTERKVKKTDRLLSTLSTFTPEQLAALLQKLEQE